MQLPAAWQSSSPDQQRGLRPCDKPMQLQINYGRADGRLFLHGTPCKLHLRRLPTADPGWQQPATRALHIHYRESELLPHLTPPCQALLRSQSGPHAAAWVTAIPTEPALTIASDHFQTALRRKRDRYPELLRPAPASSRPGL